MPDEKDTMGDAPSESSLDTVVKSLTSEQLKSLVAALPAEQLRDLASDQEHPLGRVVQSEADRKMESWRQNDLKRQARERETAEAEQRAKFYATAPDADVARAARTEAQQKALEDKILYDQLRGVFNTLRPKIEALPAEHRARVEEYINSPGANLGGVYDVFDTESAAAREAAQLARQSSDAEKARQLANAVTRQSPADVGRGGAPQPTKSELAVVVDYAGGSGSAYYNGPADDIEETAERLRAIGWKSPPVKNKK